MIQCENYIDNAYFASKTGETPVESQKRWEEIYQELNKEEAWIESNGHIRQTSLTATIKKKQNRSMEKYFYFLWEEFYRLK
jgi:hypothetical protein